MFDGMFDIAQWKMKSIKIEIPKDCNGKIDAKLSYANFKAEVNTKLPIDVIDNNSSEDISFVFSSSSIADIIKLCNDDEEFTITCNNLPPDTEHGIGFLLITNTKVNNYPLITAMCSKLIESE